MKYTSIFPEWESEFFPAECGYEVIFMELIRIGENKIKIMLSASDMSAYDLPSESFDYCDEAVREAFRAVLKDAGKKTGLDFSGGRLSIQLYPSKSGGCEMFVTKNSDGTRGARYKPISEGVPDPPDAHPNAEKDEIWEGAEVFGFDSMHRLLSACHALLCAGFCGKSAAFLDERKRCFLLLNPAGRLRPITAEYGKSESTDAVRLYISEHGREICHSDAVETLGAL